MRSRKNCARRTHYRRAARNSPQDELEGANDGEQDGYDEEKDRRDKRPALSLKSETDLASVSDIEFGSPKQDIVKVTKRMALPQTRTAAAHAATAAGHGLCVSGRARCVLRRTRRILL